MTDDLEDSAQWRDSVETRLGRLEATVGEEARLRAAMDEDQGNLKAELGAHKRLLQSIHDTQSDHTRGLTGLETGQEETNARLRTFEERLETVHVGVQMIHDKLDRLLDMN